VEADVKYEMDENQNDAGKPQAFVSLIMGLNVAIKGAPPSPL
jgi:hypothetical protein